MAIVASNDFTAAKIVTYSGARPDDHWIKKSNAYLPQLAWHILVSLKLLVPFDSR